MRVSICRATLLLSMMVYSCTATAVTLDSCSAIHKYLQGSLPTAPYTLWQDMKGATEFLGGQPSACASYDIERVRWTYADSLSQLSQSFANDASATANWTNLAVPAYQNYLEWFLSLGRSEQTALIQAVTGHRIDSEFDTYRRHWLRQRVGGALNSMGVLLEAVGQQRRMVDAYAQFAADCLDAGAPCMDIVPVEVVKRWSKWLRAIPDYARQHSDLELRRLIKSDDDASQAWAGFKSFLDSYVSANPSVKAQWEPLRRKIEIWLS